MLNYWPIAALQNFYSANPMPERWKYDNSIMILLLPLLIIPLFDPAKRAFPATPSTIPSSATIWLVSHLSAMLAARSTSPRQQLMLPRTDTVSGEVSRSQQPSCGPWILQISITVQHPIMVPLQLRMPHNDLRPPWLSRVFDSTIGLELLASNMLLQEKTVVLLPRFRSQADRDHAIQLYLERGLLERNILVNPRDFPAGSPSRSNAELKYGVKYLGIYIGSEKFISAKLETVMSTLEQQADEIMAYATGNGHRAFYLLQKSFSKKFCYHQRMTNPGVQCQVLKPDKKGGRPHHWLRNFSRDVASDEVEKETWRVRHGYTRGHCLGLLCL
jgi:hypothetical protein